MRNRRQAEVSEIMETSSGFRLRHLLLLGVLASLAYALYPRAHAAWRLHDQANHFANYGSCMAGPTGPQALLEDPPQFYQLVRRRLLVSDSEAAPFATCARLAGDIAGTDFEALHRLSAASFSEYAGRYEPKASLVQMQVSAQYLAELAEAAWPFVRSGYAQLVKPSSHAREAAHPLPFERPSLGSGLPPFRAAHHATWSDRGRMLLTVGQGEGMQVFESRDTGLNWRATSLGQPGIGSNAGRCTTGGEPRAFAFEGGTDGVSIISLSGDEPIWRVTLGTLSGIVNAACDGGSALLVGPMRSGKNGLFVCRHGGHCGQVPVQPEWLEGEFDVARVAGVNVVATVYQGVVRVRSTRDEGASWAPPTVAFDYLSYPDLPTEVKLPTRLLSVGKRLYLHGAGAPGQRYPVLYSDDFGASFRGGGPGLGGRVAGSALRELSEGPTDPIVGLGAR